MRSSSMAVMYDIPCTWGALIGLAVSLDILATLRATPYIANIRPVDIERRQHVLHRLVVRTATAEHARLSEGSRQVGIEHHHVLGVLVLARAGCQLATLGHLPVVLCDRDQLFELL